MIQLLPGIALLFYCIYGFCRETHLDYKRFQELDRLNDERILQKMNDYFREQAAKSGAQSQKYLEQKKAVKR